MMTRKIDELITPEQKQKAEALKSDVEKLFTEHPAATGETYLEHLWFTIRMGARIISCGSILVVHGIFPFLFTKTVSLQIEQIYAILKNRIPKQRLQEIDDTRNWDI